jgi:formylglycine-generating enzyme required for sulfatase activity
MANGKREIFVSYARADGDKVAAIVEALRKSGVDVWIDHQAIRPATVWRTEIVEAIAACSLLLFFASEHSCASENVQKELTLASEERKPILPVFIEPAELSPDVRFQVAGVQHIAWYEDNHRAVKQIVTAIKDLLKRNATGDSTREFSQGQSLEQRSGWSGVALAAAIAFLLIAVAVICVKHFSPANSDASVDGQAINSPNSGPGENVQTPPSDRSALAQATSADSGIPANTLGMKLVWIEPGSFAMGSDPSEDGRSPDERLHTVRLTKGFYIGQSAVTVSQFAAYIHGAEYQTDAEKAAYAVEWTDKGWNKVVGGNWKHPGFEQSQDEPAVDISWNDATAFCAWLSAREGRHYRLPTEAEWEYCARAGTNTAFAWGVNPNDGVGRANFRDQSWADEQPDAAKFNWSDGYKYTSPVGKFPANAWGLFDMPGNVANWCTDWYGRYPQGDVSDPQVADDSGAVSFDAPSFYEDSSGPQRVVRGGSWDADPSQARLAARSRGVPEAAWSLCGFRVVMDSVAPLTGAAAAAHPAAVYQMQDSYYMETVVQSSDYQPYIGMHVRFKMLVTQNGTSIEAQGEKISEVVDGQENILSGRAKTSIDLTGNIQTPDGNGPLVLLRGKEASTSRGDFPAIFELWPDQDGTLNGTFKTTSANSNGSTNWIPESQWQKTGWAGGSESAGPPTIGN